MKEGEDVKERPKRENMTFMCFVICREHVCKNEMKTNLVKSHFFSRICFQEKEIILMKSSVFYEKYISGRPPFSPKSN